MKEELLKGTVIAADETDIQVLNEKDRLPSAMSKMWVYRSISRSVDRDDPPPIILFEYQPDRPFLLRQAHQAGARVEGAAVRTEINNKTGLLGYLADGRIELSTTGLKEISANL